VLAEAGLLDGRRATTHWLDAPALAERYPVVRVDPRVLCIEEGRVRSSAGIAAGIEPCLHIVRTAYRRAFRQR
jgi:transcriptional regulator GlxA family with amidase domain